VETETLNLAHTFNVASQSLANHPCKGRGHGHLI